MCDYKEIMRVIRPAIYLFIYFCGKKTANSSTLANLQQRIGTAKFAKGKKKGLIKTHRPHTKSKRIESLRQNQLSYSIYFPLNFIFSRELSLGFDSW
jgi:hypothetical protein